MQNETDDKRYHDIAFDWFAKLFPGVILLFMMQACVSSKVTCMCFIVYVGLDHDV